MAFPNPLDPDDPIDRLQVAFGMFVSRLIVDADGIVDFGELKLLSQAFPDELLTELGFLDDRGLFTPAYRKAYTEASTVLPEALSLRQKLELITLFHRTCMADGELIQAELLVLREAAELLGLELSELATHLESLKSISTLR